MYAHRNRLQDAAKTLALYTLLQLLCMSIAHAAIASRGSRPTGRIVGGLPANDINIPYIVSLVTYGFHSCGGAIVNERTVLTAAHCLAFTTPRLLQVHAGSKTRSLQEGVVVAVEGLSYHPDWTMDTMDYDIGIVRLAAPLTFGATIRPIALPSANEMLRDGSYATVAGWGYQSVMGPGSEVLRYARVPLVNRGMCNRLMRGSITERMICAGFMQGGVDACQMDSGGPLVQQQTLIGIVSWGIGCAYPNRPGVYTRVSALLPWVTETLAKEYNDKL